MPDTLFDMWWRRHPDRFPLAEQEVIASPAGGPWFMSDRHRHCDMSGANEKGDRQADLPLDSSELKLGLSCPNQVRR
jgi:hypothetical protein